METTALHGHLYEINLVTLFLIRAIDAEYDFELTSNNESIGGKFNDVILRYRTTDKKTNREKWRSRYLTAKHRINSTKEINSTDLLNSVGDFSLQKYFQSYSMMVARGDDIKDCIICTNIGFNTQELEKNGISLVAHSKKEKILNFSGFSANDREPTLYRLKLSDQKQLELVENWSDSYTLAKQLEICATNNKITDPRIEIFKVYNVALVDEKVIDLKSGKFHQDFIGGSETLSPGAKLLRQTLCLLIKEEKWKEWKFRLNEDFGKELRDGSQASLPSISTAGKVQEFFDKLVFVVNSPSQDEFINIFQSDDICKYYPDAEKEIQTYLMCVKMVGWFIRKRPEWLTPKFGAEILLSGVRKSPDYYQKKLIGLSVNFSREAINAMMTILEDQNSPYRSIASQLPDWTAVKVIRAIEAVNRDNMNQDDAQRRHCWLTKFNQLHDHQTLWRSRIKLMDNVPGQHFLVVIGDEANTKQQIVCHDLIADVKHGKITIVIICPTTDEEGVRDDIRFKDLDERTMSKLLETEIKWQTAEIKVERLIPLDFEGRERVLDFLSIQELWNRDTRLRLPQPEMSDYDQSSYMKRRLAFCFGSTTKELLDQCKKNVDKQVDIEQIERSIRIDAKGNIEWWTLDAVVKRKVWQIIKLTMETVTPSQIQSFFHDYQLIDIDQRSKVIVTGTAGAGKSTLLSHLCHLIRKDDRYNDYAVLKIRLADHGKTLDSLIKSLTLNQTTNTQIDGQIAIDFMIKAGLDQNTSQFIRSLIKHRLETGDRIFVLLDDVHQLSSASRDILIKSMSHLNESVRIFITSQTPCAPNLEFDLCQLAYELVPFDGNDYNTKQKSDATNIGTLSRAPAAQSRQPLMENLKLIHPPLIYLLAIQLSITTNDTTVLIRRMEDSNRYFYILSVQDERRRQRYQLWEILTGKKSTITPQSLKENNTDFSLFRHFRSYCDTVDQGDHHLLVDRYVIWTDGDINLDEMRNKSIDWQPIEDMFQFCNWPTMTQPSSYKIRRKRGDFDWSLHFAATSAGRLDDRLDRVDEFLDKLVLVVQTPTKQDIEEMIQFHVGNYSPSQNTHRQSLEMIQHLNESYKPFAAKVDKWPFKMDGQFSEWPFQVREILLSNATRASKEYENKLLTNNQVEFTDEALAKIGELIESPHQFLRIVTPSPEWTCVKILKRLEGSNNYWITTSQCLDEEHTQWRNRLELKKNFLIVCDNEARRPSRFYTSLIPNDPAKKCKIIVVSQLNDNQLDEGNIRDSITLQDLAQADQILAKKVYVQRSLMSVADWIGPNQCNRVFDLATIKQLLLLKDDETPIILPSFQSEEHQPSVYISRRMACSFGNVKELYDRLSQLLDMTQSKLCKLCNIDLNGHFQWDAELEERQKWEIWNGLKAMEKEVKTIVDEDQLVASKDKKRVIICGIAGTGKSLLLSSLSKKIIERDSKCLVLKIDLKLLTKIMEEMEEKPTNSRVAIDWILRLFAEEYKDEDSPFARALLTDRLKTGDGIVLMIDGFDDLDTHYQDVVIVLIRNINPSVRIFITTRSQTASRLQLELSQLAYHLMKFENEDLSQFLISIFQEKNQAEGKFFNQENVETVATTIVNQLKDIFSDQELEFFSVPSMCRELADHFLSKLSLQDKFETSFIKDMLEKLVDLGDSDPGDRLGYLVDDGSFRQSVYIKRQAVLSQWQSLHNHLAEELYCSVEQLKKEISIDDKGSIQWNVTSQERKSKIWSKLYPLLEPRFDNSTQVSMMSERELIESDQKKVIITGVAGTGKSTVLSKLYEKMREEKPDHLVIKINLSDQSPYLYNLGKVNAAERLFELIQRHLGYGLRTALHRSLLRHRLETGDRIVLMMDGFDEINGKCQDILLRLIDSLHPSVQLYITSRSFMADKLQYHLSQVAFSLVQFDAKTQINYVVTLWRSHLRYISNQEGRILENFAEQLIDKVSKTLNEREKHFIGIPMKCRLLAESFQPNIQQLLTQQEKRRVSETDKEDDFRLANLYKLLMRSKRRSFTQEKIRPSSGNILDEYCTKLVTKAIDRHLQRLALRTIVPQHDYDESFNVMEELYRSDRDWKEDEMYLNKLGTAYGLLVDSADGSNDKFQFIHRTYAEYLVAELIYNAMVPEDETENNRLLENPITMKFVTKKLLVEKKYDGVRVFLNSMLEEMVEKTINNLPPDRKVDPFAVPYRIRLIGRSFLKYSGRNQDSVLETALNSMHHHIVAFYFYCIHATPIPRGQKILHGNNFDQWKIIFLSNEGNFGHFLRHNKEDKVLVQIFHHFGRYLCDLKNQNISDVQIKDFLTNVRYLLKFMKIQQERRETAIKSSQPTPNSFSVQLFSSNWNANTIMTQLIFYEANYVDDPSSSLIKLYLELLLFLPRTQLVAKLQMAIHDFYCTTDYWQLASIEKTLHILMELKLAEVTTKVMRIVLLKEPKIFEKFYLNRPFNIVKQEINVTSQLHVAAYYNDCDSVQLWLDDERKNLNKNSKKKAAKSVVDILTNKSKEDITPFYIAAAVGHEMIAFNFMEFLKISLTSSELTDCYTNNNGFLRQAYLDAVEVNHVKMIEVIEIVTKAALGSEALEVLTKQKFLSFPDRHANDKNQSDSFDKWTTKLLDDDLDKAVEKLFLDSSADQLGLEYSRELIKKMTSSQRLVADDKENSRSFWANYVLALNNNPRKTKNRVLINATRSMDIFKKIANKDTKLPIEDIRLLLLHRDGEEFVMIQPALIIEKNGVDQTLATLSPQVRQEFRNLLKIEAPKKIQQLFFEPKVNYFKMPKEIHKYKALLFYLDYGNERQLEQFGRVVTEEHIIDGKTTSIWKDATVGLNAAKFETIVTHVSSKVVLSRESVDRMIFQSDGTLQTEWRTSSMLEKVAILYSHMTGDDRIQIVERIYETPSVVQNLWDEHSEKPNHFIKKHLKIDLKSSSVDLLNGLTLFNRYFVHILDARQLHIFVEYITQERILERRRRSSLWTEYVRLICESKFKKTQASTSIHGFDRFLQRVVSNLGRWLLEKLVFHDLGNGDVLYMAAKNNKGLIWDVSLRKLIEDQKLSLSKYYSI